MDDPRLKAIETRLAGVESSLGKGGARFDTLEKGHKAILERLDVQDSEMAIAKSAALVAKDVSEKTLAETQKQTTQLADVYRLAVNMQSAGNFFNRIMGGFAAVGRAFYRVAAWIARAVHVTAKFLWPILAVIGLIGAIYAWLTTGKPPSVTEEERQRPVIARQERMP